MSEMTDTKPSKLSTWKVKALVALGAATPLVGYVSAAINFTPIQELLEAVVDLIPVFMTLVVEMAPLIVTISIIGFVIKFLDRILEWLNIR